MAPPTLTRHHERNHPAWSLQQNALRAIREIIKALDEQLAIELPLQDENLNVGVLVDYNVDAAPKIDESLRRTRERHIHLIRIAKTYRTQIIEATNKKRKIIAAGLQLPEAESAVADLQILKDLFLTLFPEFSEHAEGPSSQHSAARVPSSSSTQPASSTGTPAPSKLSVAGSLQVNDAASRTTQLEAEVTRLNEMIEARDRELKHMKTQLDASEDVSQTEIRLPLSEKTNSYQQTRYPEGTQQLRDTIQTGENEIRDEQITVIDYENEYKSQHELDELWRDLYDSASTFKQRTRDEMLDSVVNLLGHCNISESRFPVSEHDIRVLIPNNEEFRMDDFDGQFNFGSARIYDPENDSVNWPLYTNRRKQQKVAFNLANVIVYCRSADNPAFCDKNDGTRVFDFAMALDEMVGDLDVELSQNGHRLKETEVIGAEWLKFHVFNMFRSTDTFNKAMVGLVYTRLVMIMPAANHNYKAILDRRPWKDQSLLEVLASLRLNMALAARGFPENKMPKFFDDPRVRKGLPHETCLLDMPAFIKKCYTGSKVDMNIDADSSWYIHHQEGDLEFMLFNEGGSESAFFTILPDGGFDPKEIQVTPVAPHHWGFAIEGLVIDERTEQPTSRVTFHWQFRNGNVMAKVNVEFTATLKHYFSLFHAAAIYDVTDRALKKRA